MRRIGERVRAQKSFSVLEDVQAGPARPAETECSAPRLVLRRRRWPPRAKEVLEPRVQGRGLLLRPIA